MAASIPMGMWARVRWKIKRCKEAVEKAIEKCKNIECEFEHHDAHHYFPLLGYSNTIR